MKEQKFVFDLQKGDVLATGQEVDTVDHGYTLTVMFTDGTFQTFLENRSISLIGETNCLYGGNRSGHSRGFCTADACY